jgi:hypothetical protein
VFLDSLKEAHLHFLEGMTNGLWICAPWFFQYHLSYMGECVYIPMLLHPYVVISKYLSSYLYYEVLCYFCNVEDAKLQYPDLYNSWREDPINFCIEGVRPVVDLWDTARQAWDEILHAKVDTLCP